MASESKVSDGETPGLGSAAAAQLRFIADAVPVLIAHCDAGQRYRFVNAAYAARFGLGQDQIIGRHLAEILGEGAYASIRPQVERALAGAAVEFEIAIPYEKLGVHFMRCTYTPERAGDGSVAGFVAVIIDITERRQIEEESRLSEAIYRAIGESIDYGVWSCTPDGRNTYASESFLQLTGLTQEQCSSFGWGQALHPDDAARTLAAWEECVRTGGDWDIEHRFRGVDGKWHDILARGVPVKDGRGQILCWAGINLNITHRKQNDHALRASEQRHRLLAETMLQGVVHQDAAGRIIAMNPAAERILGKSREQFLGSDSAREEHDTIREDGTNFPGAEHPSVLALQTGRPVRGVVMGVFNPRLAAYRWISIDAVPVFPDGAAQAAEVYAVFEDITDRRQAEESLREAKEAAEAANTSKDRFLAVLSHELRTPLTPVLMAIGALECDPGLRPEVREDLAMMKRNIALETKLIDDLLDLSRIISGKLQLALETLPLNDAVRQVCGICRPQLQERGLRLETDLDEATGSVTADPARLQQVLWNVLKNAIKFTPENGTIRVRTQRLGARCEVRVQDSGIGIPADTLPRIFDAFEQGDASVTRQFGGLGLGLAICKALVELHRGSIRAESAGPGQGAVFTIGLPVADPAPGPLRATAAPAENDPAPRLRLLLVEDHADTAQTLSRLLTRAGFAVVTATDVASAVAAATRAPFDVLVSDLGLPDGTGYEVMQRVRALRPMPGIAMSGYGMDEDLRRSHEAGFAEHLVKPIEVSQLVAAIRRTIAATGT